MRQRRLQRVKKVAEGGVLSDWRNRSYWKKDRLENQGKVGEIK